MKGTIVSAEKLKANGWIFLGSLAKKDLLFYKKGEREGTIKMIGWNPETHIVVLVGELI